MLTRDDLAVAAGHSVDPARWLELFDELMGLIARRFGRVEPYPPADAADREAAHVVRSHPEQGWSLLCNGAVLFDDTGMLLPGGQIIAPHPALR